MPTRAIWNEEYVSLSFILTEHTHSPVKKYIEMLLYYKNWHH